MKKKTTYSPKDAAENCGVEVARRKGRKGTGREGGMEGEVGSMVVGSRQKNMTEKFFLLVVVVFFVSLRRLFSRSRSRSKKKMRGGLVGGFRVARRSGWDCLDFQSRVLFVKRPQKACPV